MTADKPKEQEEFLAKVSAWGTEVQPNVKELSECIKATDDVNINTTCKLKQYKESYKKFYKENLENYEKNSSDAVKNSIEEYLNSDSDSGTSVNDVKARKMNILTNIGIVAISVFFLIMAIDYFWKRKVFIRRHFPYSK
jgi:hypothetical protein